MFKAYIFSAKTVPTPQELHCLVAHLFNKQDVDIKIRRNGRIISVVSDTNIEHPTDIALKTNQFEFKRTENVKLFEATAGSIVTISLSLCYSIKRTSSNRTESPFGAFGQIKPHCYQHFLQYLEKATGLTGLVEGVAEVGLEPHAMSIKEEQKGKVWFVGACDLVIRAPVANPAVFATLAGRAIGNRRSYGFGSVCLDFVEVVEPEPAANYEDVFSVDEGE